MTTLATILLIVGGLNWGLVGFFDYNLVDAIFGAGSTVSRIIYALVGLAALWDIFAFPALVRRRTETTTNRYDRAA